MSAADGQFALEPTEVERLRAAHYNATVSEVFSIHSELRILRVVPDGGLPPFDAGQFLSLGLGNWERRIGGVDEEQIDAAHRERLARRAYSISCSLAADDGVLRRASDFPYLEFYVALVRHGQKRPPALTPRLFALGPGDRLFAERHAAGSYTLAGVRPDDDVFFFATGTGEAPHNAMLAELLTRGHRGRIVNVVSVRYLHDAAYRAGHERLAEQHANYRYFVLTTRETPSEQPRATGIIGHCHLQDAVASGRIERESSAALDPAQAQVFLCGNSTMIGAQHAAPSTPPTILPGSMLDLLSQRGFQRPEAGQSGNVHFERYW